MEVAQVNADMLKSLWIDDMRDPSHSLSEEQCQSVEWVKDAWEARRYVFGEKMDLIHTLYLDNFLGDDSITGEAILAKIAFKAGRKNIFPNLKTIYLHTSDEKILKRCLAQNKERLNKAGIELLEATYWR